MTDTHHSVTVPSSRLPTTDPPMLSLHLTIDELCNVIRRHLTRVAASGHLRVEFRTSHQHGLTTTIHATEDTNGQ